VLLARRLLVEMTDDVKLRHAPVASLLDNA
jgi:hypothetical protein